MQFTRPITDVLEMRSSRRTFRPKPIETERRQVLEQWLASAPTGPFGSVFRLELVAATEDDRGALSGLGTYGFIRGAPGFIVGAVTPGARDMEDFGYVMEEAILLTTDLELGTCWLGGTFTRSTFAEKIALAATETIPAVVAIGHAATKRGAVEKLIRWGAKAKKRRPWERLFFTETFERSLSREAAGDYATVLDMVRIGPSASNRQPWRIVRAAGSPRYHFFVRRTPGYGRDSKLFELADLQRIDMGIAMCHFALTATELGLPGGWSDTEPDVGALPEHIEYIATWDGECVCTPPR